VVHLEQEQGDDPEENLGVRHADQRIDTLVGRAMGRWAQSPRLGVLRVPGAERDPGEEPLRPDAAIR
jgi:hypothetical protein